MQTIATHTSYGLSALVRLLPDVVKPTNVGPARALPPDQAALAAARVRHRTYATPRFEAPPEGARVLDSAVPAADPARIAHLLGSIAEGWAPGKIPSETYVRPYMNSTDLLNRRNARVIDLEGVQCLVWHRASEAILHLEVRLRNPWFPAWHWPGPSLEWRLSRSKSPSTLDARIIEQARDCLPAVASVRQVAKTALSECEGRTRFFSPAHSEPDWGTWAEQYMLASALLGAKFTAITARTMSTRVKQAAITYFGGTDPHDYSPVPDRVLGQFCAIGWLAADILAGQTGVTKPRPNKAFT